MQPSEVLPPSRKRVLKELSGLRFGTLSVLSRAENYAKGKNREARWHVRCDKCGRESVVRGGHLRSGDATGSHCVGCKPHAPEDAPALVIDSGFVRRWTPMMCKAASQVVGGFGAWFWQLRDDIIADTLLALSKFRGTVHPDAMSTFVFNIAKTKAIDHIEKHLRTPQLRASNYPEAPDDYYRLLSLLTDGADEFQVNQRTAVLQQAFTEELTADEQEFALQYVSEPKGQSKTAQNRMWRIRLRLRERLKQLQETNSMPEVHEQQ